MNQKYKFKSLEIAKNTQEKPKEAKIVDPTAITVFETGETRTLDFIQKDGTRQNFAYSHYLTAWLGKDGNERVIKIFFATHLVTIKGYCLDELYEQIISFFIKTVKVNDERYLDMISENVPFVKDVSISWKTQVNIDFS